MERGKCNKIKNHKILFLFFFYFLLLTNEQMIHFVFLFTRRITFPQNYCIDKIRITTSKFRKKNETNAWYNVASSLIISKFFISHFSSSCRTLYPIITIKNNRECVDVTLFGFPCLNSHLSRFFVSLFASLLFYLSFRAVLYHSYHLLKILTLKSLRTRVVIWHTGEKRSCDQSSCCHFVFPLVACVSLVRSLRWGFFLFCCYILFIGFFFRRATLRESLTIVELWARYRRAIGLEDCNAICSIYCQYGVIFFSIFIVNLYRVCMQRGVQGPACTHETIFFSSSKITWKW